MDTRPDGVLARGVRLGSVRGIALRADWSLIVVFVLVATNLALGLFPRWHPDWSRALSWTVALAAAVLFFASILAHELSHALVARRHGMSVRSVTLFLFGGVTHMETSPPTPKAEFWMAIVGPLTSAAIGIVATLLGVRLATDVLGAAMGGPDVAALEMHRVGPLATLLLWLGPVNVSLALFNLVPGFPLDGGRVLRAIAWAVTHDLAKATRWASGAGQLFAWVLIAFGVMNAFAGGLTQGLWLILIGWFLSNAARASYADIVVRQALHDVPVRRVMRTRLDRVSPALTIDEFVREHLMQTDQLAFPVERDGALVGLVGIDDVRKVPQRDWQSATVERIMTPAASLATVAADVGAERALEELARRDVEQLPVVEGDHLVGVVRRGDLFRWLALQHGAPTAI